MGSIGHSADDMAKMMYHSLWNKIATLPDNVQVCLNVWAHIHVCQYCVYMYVRTCMSVSYICSVHMSVCTYTMGMHDIWLCIT